MVDRIHVLRVGHIAMPERFLRSGGRDGQIVIPVLCFLVVSDERVVLIDTGCSPAVVEDAEKAWGKLAKFYQPQISREELVDAQVRAAGFDMSDITDVVLTHLHMDHSGGLRLVQHRPRLWVQRAEFRWASCPDPHGAGGYFREDFDLDAFETHLLDGDTMLGDDICLITTNGHSVGHQSVLVRLRSQLVCLAGDVAYTRELFDRRTVPAVASDTGKYMEALTRVATLEQFFEAQVLLSHDVTGAASLTQVGASLT